MVVVVVVVKGMLTPIDRCCCCLCFDEDEDDEMRRWVNGLCDHSVSGLTRFVVGEWEEECAGGDGGDCGSETDIPKSSCCLSMLSTTIPLSIGYL